jgi:hypothetical protein
VRRLVASLLGAGAVAAFGVVLSCGGRSTEEQSACSLLPTSTVLDAMRDAGARPPSLTRSASESLDQSICRFTARGINVRLTVDTASHVRRRYFTRVTEQQTFAVHRPQSQPQPIEGLGDDDAYGPAGAYWIAAQRQLFALSGERLLNVAFSVDGVGANDSRVAAERLARAALGQDKDDTTARAPRDPPSPPLQLSVITPADGELVRSPKVTVQGTVTGRRAVVRVAGRRAQVRQGIFARAVMLRRGTNRIRIVATGQQEERKSESISVERGRSAYEVATAFARRHPGVVPDVIGERLNVAESILRYAGFRSRPIKISPGPLVRESWAVCLTRPAADTRLDKGRRVLLLVDHADIFRASGTACARD